MSSPITSITDEALIAFDTLADRASNLIQPTLRLGVTGLSRAGKTVFITALVHNLLHGGRLPMFRAAHTGRLARAYLEPQPDDAVPRFQYEDHTARMIGDRIWPDSTRAISELRLVIEYESASGWNRFFSGGRLCLDIVDYPGEWLLDLPLLAQDYAQFSHNAASLARSSGRHDLAAPWLEKAASIDPHSRADEASARELAQLFTDYLRACKTEDRALSTLPPGRFLMPGDLDGSPALTFAPLPNLPDGPAPKGSLQAMMERRFESYKSVVVKPFFREHVTRLDRQIVLIDAMQAMNAGREAVIDLERALSDVLSCFRPGGGNFLTNLISRRIDKVLIAATKADHLHHESHDRLEAIARRIVERASANIGASGADIDVLAMAAVRATKEATARQDGEELPVIVGTPLAGERIDGELFDGNRKTAIFPGDLPKNPDSFFKAVDSDSRLVAPEINIVRFRPPLIEQTETGMKLSLPHIRLDRAMEYLLGDRLA
ncbi:YcjX family protein [Hoeflea olei]|uniref:Amino acid regulated cytosolic protein n=1 Tax=Hoeflea olei TaxID=1480615 RepID=A0A1C1YZC5_9HYPH|nr:YcjX family protein [Hoeflea olei]OCW58769.1 amino acid regulated cytosolic protein [Hoeflea olei]